MWRQFRLPLALKGTQKRTPPKKQPPNPFWLGLSPFPQDALLLALASTDVLPAKKIKGWGRRRLPSCYFSYIHSYFPASQLPAQKFSSGHLLFFTSSSPPSLPSLLRAPPSPRFLLGRFRGGFKNNNHKDYSVRAQTPRQRANLKAKMIFIFKKCNLHSVHIIWTPQYYVHIQDIKKWSLLHIERTLLMISRFILGAGGG